MKVALAFVAVAALVLWKNPVLFSSRPLWTADPLGGTPAPITFAAVRDPAATALYRGGIERRGQLMTVMETGLSSLWISRATNVGIHDASKSSPAIDKDGIFVGADSGWFYALDFDGRELWRFQTAYNERGIHATAALSADAVFFGAYNGRFYALDKKTGRVRWVTRLGETVGSSALLDHGAVYVSVETFQPNGFVVKLSAEDGHLIWKSAALGDQSHSSPALDAKSDTLVVGANSQKLFGLNAQTGEFRWVKQMEGEIKSTPALADGRAYVTDRAGWLTAVDVSTGNEAWHTRLTSESEKHSSGSQSSPALLPEKNLLVTATRSGSIFGVRLSDGQVIWQRLASGKQFIASPVITKTKKQPWLAWIQCEPNLICAFEPETGTLVKKYDVQGAVSGEVTFFDGRFYVSTNGMGRFRTGHVAAFGPPPKVRD